MGVVRKAYPSIKHKSWSDIDQSNGEVGERMREHIIRGAPGSALVLKGRGSKSRFKFPSRIRKILLLLKLSSNITYYSIKYMYFQKIFDKILNGAQFKEFLLYDLNVFA